MKRYVSLMMALALAAALCALLQDTRSAKAMEMAPDFTGTHLLALHFDSGKTVRTLLMLDERVGPRHFRGWFELDGEVVQVMATYPASFKDLAELVAMGTGFRIIARKHVTEEGGVPLFAEGPFMMVGPGIHEGGMMHITYFVDGGID